MRRESRWGGPKTGLTVLLVAAAGLRLVGLRYGLPFGNLLEPDEQNIVPRAWRMVHGGGANPHWFQYPSLLFYVLAPFQAWQHAPSFLTARIVVAFLGVGAVGASWWLARRAYGSVAGAAVAAGIVAVSVSHVAYSHAAVTDIPLTLGVASALALMVSGRIELAGVAAGLATGFKQPGILLAVPLLVAGWRQWRRLAVGYALLVLAFFASSPFVLVDRRRALHDLFYVQHLARRGWLGYEHDGGAIAAFPHDLWRSLGPALIVALVGLGAALVHRRRADLILVAFTVAYFLELLTLRSHFERYVLPLVPPLAALAGRLRFFAPVTLLLLVVPAVASVRADARLTRTDTRIAAYRWAEGHIGARETVAEDPSTPTLSGHSTLALALPGPGRPFDANRNLARLQARRVRYVFVTGAVTDRVLAARDRYPREARFYDELARRPRVYYLRPGHGYAGPWVAIYRL